MDTAEKAGSGEITIAISRSILSNKRSKAVRHSPAALLRYSSLRKKGSEKAAQPQPFQNPKIKIILPLNMPKAAEGISNRLHPGTPGGPPCGAQGLLFRLGELFQGGFPA